MIAVRTSFDKGFLFLWFNIKDIMVLTSFKAQTTKIENYNWSIFGAGLLFKNCGG